MCLTRLPSSARRSVIVLGLLAAATASGVRPLSVGARTALPAVDGVRAMQSSSTSRAPTSAVFEVKVTPDSGIGQGATVYISGTAPVDAANRPVKLTVTPRHESPPVSGTVPLRESDGFFLACYNLTAGPGDYRVDVDLPGGGAAGTTRFSVDPGFGPPDPGLELGGLAVHSKSTSKVCFARCRLRLPRTTCRRSSASCGHRWLRS